MSKFKKELNKRLSAGEINTFCTWIKKEKNNLLVHPLRFSGSYQEGLSILRNLPRVPDDKGYLYIIQLGAQRIKVGKTCNPIQRLVCHQDNFTVYNGESFNFISVFGPFENVSKEEDKLISHILSIGGETYAGNEWFHFKTPFHVFDIGFKPTVESFMFYWIQEVFEEFIKDSIKEIRKGSILESGELQVKDLFELWAKRFEIPEPVPIDSFLVFMKNLCRNNPFFKLRENNSILQITNLKYTS